MKPNSLPGETAAALTALQPRDIAVLGGASAVSDAVLHQLQAYTTGGVNRLAGADRYATAARVAQVFWPSTSEIVYVATGRNFADALAGVPAAGRDQAPLLLVEPNCMPAATRQELHRLQPSTVVVLGGPATVTEAAVSGTSCVVAPTPIPTRRRHRRRRRRRRRQSHLSQRTVTAVTTRTTATSRGEDEPREYVRTVVHRVDAWLAIPR